MSMRLAGKTALVTGAASGIGAAVVRRFREEGAEVIAAGLQPGLLAELARESGASAADCDVTQEADVRRAVEQARASGRLDIVVNAAGIVQNDDVGGIDDRVWERTLAVNLTGAMRVCRAAIPQMQRQGGGAIVNIASVAAFNASTGMGSYAPSKAGLVALTRSIANRYGADAIRANCLCPGWVRTPMSEMEMREAGGARGIDMEAAFDELKSRIALQRIALPAEMAACVLFLASDDASFVTGAVLVADGGAKTAAAARAN
jgi:NAD(P)-dependent dehydrogenase (short-subunit alcohol dehydrogenase family)